MKEFLEPSPQKEIPAMWIVSVSPSVELLFGRFNKKDQIKNPSNILPHVGRGVFSIGTSIAVSIFYFLSGCAPIHKEEVRSPRVASNVYTGIKTTSGDIVEVPRPASVAVGEFESDSQIRVFNERQNVMLTDNLVVNITAPGFYHEESNLVDAKIPKGTRVNSYLVHFDPSYFLFTFLSGSVTFGKVILGVIVLESDLDDSDVLGDPVMSYPPGNLHLRGAELHQTDSVKIEDDRRTLAVELSTRYPMDQIRVITAPDSTTAAELEPDLHRKPAVATAPVPREAPSPVPQRKGKRFAVLIGIGDYQDPSISDLNYAAADVKSVYSLLTDPSRGGFPKENVQLILDRKATRRSIVKAIGDWLFRKAGPDDEVFVYYAGHGAVEKDRTGTEPDGLGKYLVPADADPKTLFVTGISNGELARMFQALKTKRLVFFLDSCYSAGTTGLGRALTATGFRAGSLSSDLYGNLAGSGQAIVAAAKPNQVALELPEFSHGLFTKFVLDGLQGRADANGDGLVTLLELYPYLSKEVPRVARQKGAIQEPVLRSSISGDLVLSSVPETLQKLSIVARVERLKKLYTEGTISAKQLEKAVKFLKTGQSNRMLEDFFKGEISTSTFKDLF